MGRAAGFMAACSCKTGCTAWKGTAKWHPLGVHTSQLHLRLFLMGVHILAQAHAAWQCLRAISRHACRSLPDLAGFRAQASMLQRWSICSMVFNCAMNKLAADIPQARKQSRGSASR